MWYQRGAFFILLLTFLGAGDLLAVEEVHRRGDYQTPHTKWLSPTPFERQPRVLFFSNYRSGSGRYANEMAQRFDLDFAQVTIVSQDKVPAIAGGDAGAMRLEDLLNQHWDAFVFFDGTPTMLLAEKYKKLYSAVLFKIVRDGAGLLLIDYMDEKVLKEKNLLPPPEIAAQSPMQATYYQIGKGLGVQIQGFDMTDVKYRTQRGYGRPPDALVVDYREGWRDQYDAMFRNIGENLLWIMNKSPVRLQLAVSGDLVSVSGALAAESRLELFLTGGGDRFTLLQDAVINGSSALTASLPPLVPGEYLLNAVVRSGGKGCTFAAKTLSIPENPLGKIEAITFSDGEFAGDVGERLSATVTFSGAGVLKYRLRDPERRILHEEVLAASGNKADLSFQIEDWMPSLLTLEVSLYDGTREISRKYEYCNRIIRRPRMFEFSAWGHPYTHNSVHDLNRRLAELGLTTLMMPGAVVKHSPFALQDYQIYSAHVFDSVPGTNPDACYLSEARHNRLISRFKKFEIANKVGLRLVSLGDEVQEHYGCMAPGCLKAYSEFLRDKYKGDLARLNRSWKTNFANWSEVGLSGIPEKNDGRDLARYVKAFMGTSFRAQENHMFVRYVPWASKKVYGTDFEDFYVNGHKNPNGKKFLENMFIDQEAGSFLEGNFARWIDRQDFKNEVYCRSIAALVDHFRKIDPNILAGMEGTGAIDYVGNLYRTSRTMAWAGAYADVNQNRVNEVLRSLTPDDFISNSWVGYTTSPKLLCDRVWNEMFRRPSMIMFYTTTGDGMPTYNGILRPDFSIFQAAEEMLQQTRKLRDGLGTSLLRSVRRDDPVAILYSYPSAAYGTRVHHGDSYDFARLSHDGAMDLVTSLGHSFRYLAAEQLEQGLVNLEDYKILLLPRVNAVSDRMAEKILAFVNGGGVVIADIRAGIFSENLLLRTPGAFDTAAGIKRSEPLPGVLSELPLPGFEKAKVLLEGGVVPTTGKALCSGADGSCAMIVNQYGKGKFVTLNFPFQQLPQLPNAGEQLCDMMAEMFSVLPRHTEFRNADNGKKVYNLRRVVWENGDMRVMGVKSQPGGTQEYLASLTAAQHVFDLNGEKSLGQVESFRFSIAPPMPAFFVLSDQPLPEISLSVPRIIRRGATFRVNYSVNGMRGERPLLLAFVRNGQPVNLCSRVETSANTDIRESQFRVALNEAPGQFSIIARDVYTGLQKEFPLILE